MTAELVADFDQILRDREAQLRYFWTYQSQLEAWLKGEILTFLEEKRTKGRISRVGREASAGLDSRKKVDLKLSFPQAKKAAWIELKHWHIGLRNGSYYCPAWYMKERHGSGVIADVEKLATIADREKYLLMLLTQNPGVREWKEGVTAFHSKYPSYALRDLTSPDDDPEYFFLGLLHVCTRAA